MLQHLRSNLPYSSSSAKSKLAMKSQALFDAMSAAVKAKGPELVKLGGAAARMVSKIRAGQLCNKRPDSPHT